MPASEDSAVEMALLKKMKQEVEAQVSMLQNFIVVVVTSKIRICHW
jgi:hypothetical protein